MISGKPAHVKADHDLPPDKGPISGNATITPSGSARAGRQCPAVPAAEHVALSTNLATRLQRGAGRPSHRADFDLTAAGDIPLAALKSKALHVRQLRLTGNYDGVKNHLALNQADLDAREGVVRLKGGADFHYDQGALASISAGFATSRLALNMPGVFAQPVALPVACKPMAATRSPGSNSTIAHASLTAPGLALPFRAASAGRKGQAPGVVMTGSMAPMPVQDADALLALAGGGGRARLDHGDIFAGTGAARLRDPFRAGHAGSRILPDDDLKLLSRSAGWKEIMSRPHPSHRRLGQRHLLGDTFTADFTGGQVGNLVVRNGHAVIPTLHAHGTVGQFTAHIDGPMPDMMTLIDMKPLGYPTRFGIDPKQTNGAASDRSVLQVPMLEDLTVDEVGISVKAEVSDFARDAGQAASRQWRCQFRHRQ